MATLATAARNAAADAVAALLNNGTIVGNTSGGSEVFTCTFGATAFAAASVGVATANSIASDSSATGGTVASVLLKTSAPATLITCTATVTGGGGDFTASTLTIGAGDTVAVSSLTLTQPA